MPLISGRFFLLLISALGVYYAVPKRARWAVLLGVSLLFCASAGGFALAYILTVSLSSYLFALLLQKGAKEGSRLVFISSFYVSVILILSAWAAVKLMARHGSLVMPLGVSFYSLRIISYLIDVKRGKSGAEKSFFKLLLFVSWFPCLIQGPVAEYRDINEPLFSGRGARGDELLSGVIRLFFGIFKKVVIANTLREPLLLIAERSYSGGYVLFLLVLYSAETYCDFSGGIDMALGISGMFGVTLPENFDRPFSSLTLREFWNRWHITLGLWLERYVFYPVSLSRPAQRLSRSARRRLGVKLGRKVPVYFATMLTWLLTGLWHGARANFIAWGLINGILVIISQECTPIFERMSARYPLIFESGAVIFLRRVWVFFVIGTVRLLDVYRSVPRTAQMLASVFYDLDGYAGMFSGGLFDIISPERLLAVLLALALVFFVSERRIRSLDAAKGPIKAAVCVFLLAFLSITLGSYGTGFDAGEFIYSRF